MTTFNDLIFKPHPHDPGGVQAKAFFPNGYGASVIRTSFSYGREGGLYELAVLRGNDDGYELAYDTPITDDVIGHLSTDSVSAILARIERLEPA